MKKTTNTLKKGPLFLFVAMCTVFSLSVQAQNLTVKITKTDNTIVTQTAQATLEDAISAIPLTEIKELEITEGAFATADWTWLHSKKTDFTAITKFTITDGATSVADIIDAAYANPLFSPSIQEASIAKVKVVGEYAFRSCSNLTSINLPQAVELKYYAFLGCTKLTTASFPQVTIIGYGAFNDCKKLTTANFPLATTIGGNAFYNCVLLTKTNFPKAITIKDYAFFGCIKLTTVDFPLVTTIAYAAFNGCNKLTTANFPLATTIG